MSKSSYLEDISLSVDTKDLVNRVTTRERNQSEDIISDGQKSKYYEEEIKSLKGKLAISEASLVKVQEFNNTLFKKLNNAEIELKKSQEELAKKSYITQIKSLELDDVNQKMSAISLSNQAELEKLKEGYEALRREMFEKQFEIQRYELLLKEKDMKIQQLGEYQAPEYSLNEMGNMLLENKILREKLVETEKSIDDLYFMKRNDSTILLEVEKLKSDIKRLIHLLKSTEEFKEFAENANLVGDDIRFLKNMHKEKGNNKNFKLWSEQRKLKSEFEGFFWVPADSYKFANDFRIKYQGQFTEEILEILLFELNKIWKDKHDKSIAKLKEKQQTKLYTLKQQYNNSNVQSNSVNQKIISRLRDQVSRTSKDLDNFKKKNFDEIDFVSATVKATAKDHKRLQSLQIENKALIAQLQKMATKSTFSKYSSPDFIEGATWIYGKIRNQVDKLFEAFKGIVEEYELRLEGILDEFKENEETTIVVSRSKWLLNGVENIFESFYDQLIGLENEMPISSHNAIENSMNIATSFIGKDQK